MKQFSYRAVNLCLLLIAGFWLSGMLFKDTSIAKLPEQGKLHKATLAAG